MKKFRIVALLLVMCLASSCFVGGTFAKYTSEASFDETANIAKWSIIVNTEDITNENGSTETLNIDVFADSYTNVRAADVANGEVPIIAPGTSGSFVIEIENASDVVVTYTLELSETCTDSPLSYTVQKNTDAATDGLVGVEDLTLGIDETVTYTVEWEWEDSNDDNKYGVKSVTDNRTTVNVEAVLTVVQAD